MTQEEVMNAHRRYQNQFGEGKRPHEDVTPTIEQLSSLKHLIESGESPFVSFAVWKPNAQRNMKRQKFTGKLFNTRCKLVDTELAGPPTFEHFKQCYKVLQTALIMLGAVDLGNVTQYLEYLEDFHRRFGEPLYALLFQADTRARSELMARLDQDAYAAYYKVGVTGQDSRQLAL